MYLLIALWVIFCGPQNPFASLVKKSDDITMDDFRFQKTQPAMSLLVMETELSGIHFAMK